MSSLQPPEIDPGSNSIEQSSPQPDSGPAPPTDPNAEIEQLVIQVRSDLKFLPRRYSGTPSYIIEDRSANRYFNLGMDEYEFVCFIDGQKPLKESYDDYIAFVDERGKQGDAPAIATLDWEQVCKVIGFFRNENLIATVNGSDAKPSAGDSKHRISNVNPIGLRLRLFDANAVSNTLQRSFGFMFSKVAYAIWLVVVVCAIGIAIRDYEKIRTDIGLLIQPENLIWLTVCWIVLKFLHEAGHAIRCRMEGGKVGDSGINFLLLLPMPFVDVTSSWRFSSAWKRISVAAAGMYIELFVAAVFLLIWSFDFGPTINSISVQVVLMASLSTVLFNANPLMKFDGYYILSDLLKRPNLAVNGMRYQRGCLKSILFGIKPDFGLTNFDWVTKTYGWLAAFWRITISVGLLIAAATFLHGAGIILAGLAIFYWYVNPFVVFLRSVTAADASQRLSGKRVAMVFGVVSLLVVGMAFLPWPFSPNASGVVAFANEHSIRTGSDGFVTEIKTFDGAIVKKGDVLIKLENDDLEFELRSLTIDRDVAILESRNKRRKNELGEWQAVEKKVISLEEQIGIIQRQIDELTIKAPASGKIVSARLTDLPGSFLKKGAELMKVVPLESLEVVASVNEFNAPIFHTAMKNSNRSDVLIRLESGASLPSKLSNVEPTASRRIIHSAISAANGGPLPIRQKANAQNREDQTELATPNFKATTLPFEVDAAERGMLVGQRCRVYLNDRNRSCLSTIQFRVAQWLRENWSNAELANKG